MGGADGCVGVQKGYRKDLNNHAELEEVDERAPNSGEGGRAEGKKVGLPRERGLASLSSLPAISRASGSGRQLQEYTSENTACKRNPPLPPLSPPATPS